MELDTLVIEVAQQYLRTPPCDNERAARQRSVLGAYARLALNADFMVVVHDLIRGTLLEPCLTAESEGERRAVLKLLRTVQLASTVQERRDA